MYGEILRTLANWFLTHAAWPSVHGESAVKFAKLALRKYRVAARRDNVGDILEGNGIQTILPGEGFVPNVRSLWYLE